MPITYPNNENEWNNYHFGRVMWEALEKQENKDDNFPKHNKQVFEAVEKLWSSGEATNIIDGVAAQKTYELRVDALHGIGPARDEKIPLEFVREHLLDVAQNQLFGTRDEYKDELLYAALLHDIGKKIIKERHAIVGWHLVGDLDPAERAKLILWLGNGNEKLGDNKFRRLLMLIRDHDKFGVLGTGEASLPILLPVAESSENGGVQARRSLAMLLVLTLADIAATDAAKPEGITSGNVGLEGAKVEVLCKDWGAFDQALSRTEAQRERLVEETVRLSQTRSATLERIHRLILDACKDKRGERIKESLREKLGQRNLIMDALDDAFGPHVGAFCEDFALIAKLDYSLYFFRDLMTYCAKKGNDPETVVETVIAVLRRITGTYRGLTREGGFNAIGVGFENLRRREEKEKRDRIIELLFTRRERALRWLVDEIAGWQVV